MSGDIKSCMGKRVQVALDGTCAVVAFKSAILWFVFPCAASGSLVKPVSSQIRDQLNASNPSLSHCDMHKAEGRCTLLP